MESSAFLKHCKSFSGENTSHSFGIRRITDTFFFNKTGQSELSQDGCPHGKSPTAAAERLLMCKNEDRIVFALQKR